MNPDIERAIRKVVQEEIVKSRDIIEAIAREAVLKALGAGDTAPARRDSGRDSQMEIRAHAVPEGVPARPSGVALRRGPGRPPKSASKAESQDAKALVGKIVRFQVGRATFSGEVVEVNAANGKVAIDYRNTKGEAMRTERKPEIVEVVEG